MVRHLPNAEEMRALDRHAISVLGIPGAVLMEHAGRAVADEVASLAPAGARVAVVAGAGNNGGDGFVCARWLRERGRDVVVLLVAGRPRAGADAALHLDACERAGVRVLPLAGSEGLVFSAAVVVDALLGIGLRDDVTGELADAIALMNSAPGRVVAVDVPSGLCADTGRARGAAVEADVTVTFGFAKVGLISSPGCARAGRIVVAEIGIPLRLAGELGIQTTLLDAAAAALLLPVRPASGHKGTFGHLLVVGGSAGKLGAGLLAAEGALRAGAGLVTLATAPAVRAACEGRLAEAMVAELDLDAASGAAALLRCAEGKGALVIGPGMSPSELAGASLRAALPQLGVPVCLDADGLNHLARNVGAATGVAGLVLTPHPGEAARLLGVTVAEVQTDRVGAARRLAQTTGAVVALKGARTVVAAPDGRAAINLSGNAGMATAGSGDVLAGVVGALLAAGVAPFSAAGLAVFAHGAAGDLARDEEGEAGVIASSITQRHGRAFAALAGCAGPG